MAGPDLPGGGQLPNPGDPDDLLDGLEPETIDGPFGLPVVKPKAAPDPPNLG